MTASQFVTYLRRQVEDAGTQRKLAERLGIGQSRISEVFNGRPPSPQLLKALGFTQRRLYDRVEGA